MKKRNIILVGCLIVIFAFTTFLISYKVYSHYIFASKPVNIEMNNNEKDVSNGKNENTKENEKGNEIPKQVKMIEYSGRIEHVFFHPLIAYTSLAFDDDNQSLGFDDWFVTVDEFKKIIQSLYDKGFILVNINEIYEEVELNGKITMKRKTLMIPEGKKPIIISFDDVNYYDYMIKNGTVSKLILDENNNVVTYSKDKEGREIISDSNEAIPILDKFIKDNPDFSLNGAKGIIALTGYEGILGYRTNKSSSIRESEIEEVKKVIKKLKETGWIFASHSYGHPDIAKINYGYFTKDTDNWEKEVESLIGETEVYIYPFGSAVYPGDNKFSYLQKKGFKIFCAVGVESYENISKSTNAVMTDRRHIDGISLRNQRDKFLDLYDSKNIIDIDVRPKR